MSITPARLSAAELAARITPRAQRAALTPFPAPRVHAAPWGLNRVPLDFRQLTTAGWTKRIELGEQLPAYQGQQPGLEIPAGEAPAARAPSAPRGGAFILGQPETRSFSWAIQNSGAVGTINALTTPIIPWPFRIIGCSYEATPSTVPINKNSELQFFAVDTDISGTPLSIPGDALMPRLGGGIAAFGIRVNSFTNAAASQQALINNPASAAIGVTVKEPGKRICIALRQSDALTNSFQGHITVEEWSGAGLSNINVRESATPILRRAAPRAPTVAPARAAPPRPGREPPYGFLAYWQGQAERLSRVLHAPGNQQRLDDARAYIAWLAAGPVQDITRTAAGARAETAFVGGGQLGTRWTLDEYPGLTFGTAAEASVYAQARAVASLPAKERAAAAEEVRRAAGRLIYGQGELATPLANLLRPLR